MHTIWGEYVNRSRKRRRNRWNEDREAPIVQFFNDEGGDESLLNFGQRRLPRLVVSLASQSLSKTSEEFIAWDFLE